MRSSRRHGRTIPPSTNGSRSRVDAFAATAAYGFESRNLARGNGEAERVLTMKVTSGFFEVLSVQPAVGRTFTAEEAQPGKGCLALLSYEASDRSANAIGSTIRLDDVPCEVIGVMPKGFAFRDDRVRVWTGNIALGSRSPSAQERSNFHETIRPSDMGKRRAVL